MLRVNLTNNAIRAFTVGIVLCSYCIGSERCWDNLRPILLHWNGPFGDLMK